ncbi:CaiB/BaiF CoA transferase family protein [Actinophytocola sp.]|uniref:CaiB/BaiF CoA transferase family protein n=1 Tax=Actinophytocola sp. TaxID=1872138 RepID=UPI003D6B2CC0
MPVPSADPLPLSGVRVLDVTHVLAGPYATTVLADLGAEIIKVERPGVGDHTRGNAPFIGGESHYFLSMNRDKRSVVLDLETEPGRAAFLKLVEKCDVVIENFRPGVMERLGLGYDVLRTARPDVIMCCISGFGKESTEPDPRPAFDITLQAMTGMMSINGFPDGPPTRLGIPLGDMSTGLFAVIGITAALRGREVTGKGRRIDVTMYRSMVSLLGYMSGYYFATGESPGRVGNGHHSVGPLGVFHAKDGDLVLGVMTSKFWHLLCDALGHPELTRDPRFKRMNDRVKNLEELRPLLNAYLSKRTIAEWEEILGAEGVPHAKIRSVGEVLDDPYTRDSGLVQTVEHPTAGRLPVIGPVLRWPGSQAAELSPPPLLGQHTAEVLTELVGLSEEEVVRLTAGLPSGDGE